MDKESGRQIIVAANRVEVGTRGQFPLSHVHGMPLPGMIVSAALSVNFGLWRAELTAALH
jgi:hypothetical protein